MAEPPIICNLDALTAEERTRRAELAEVVGRRAEGLEELASGFRLRLPNDAALCRQALELIVLERRCCPFLSLELVFEPGDGPVHLHMGGPPGVKEFLRENGALGTGCGESCA